MSKSFLSKMGSIILALTMVFQMAVPVYGAEVERVDERNEECSYEEDLVDIEDVEIDVIDSDDETDYVETDELNAEDNAVGLIGTECEDVVLDEFFVGESEDLNAEVDGQYLAWRGDEGTGGLNFNYKIEFLVSKGIEKVEFRICTYDEKANTFYYVDGIKPIKVNVSADHKWIPVEFSTKGLDYGDYYLFADYFYSGGKAYKNKVKDAGYFHFWVLTKEELVWAFVDRMYTNILGRDPEEKGRKYWVTSLRNGTVDGAGIAEGFVLSDECIQKEYNNKIFVNRLYLTFLGRFPADSEVNYWANMLENGTCRADVLAGFVNSDEFRKICSDFGIKQGVYTKKPRETELYSSLTVISTNVNRGKIEEYVTRLYKVVLGRKPERAGLDDWTNRIISNEMNAGEVAASFFQSQEYLNKHKTDGQFIKDAYSTFFARKQDKGGYNYWLRMLTIGEYDRNGVIAVGFGHSAEFQNLLRSYGFEVYQ